LGVRAIPFGVAAIFLTFGVESAGTRASPEDTGSPVSGISVFGTIHPDIFRFRTPLGSGRPTGRLQLASLEPRVGLDALATLTDTSDTACRNGSLDVALDDRPATLDERMVTTDDCPVSFDDRFRAAMPVLASALRSAPDRDFQSQRADMPRSIVFRTELPARQVHTAVPLPGDDGRTAIYDITAHTVYLPSGRRLEAHSGVGGLMDNPHHVHLKMRGPTPPNVYDLTLRERIFHGVRAIRLNPVDESRMHGRDGILAHSYMLGPNGQSNGCVAFRNYPEFLDAFLKGEVARLAVVDRLESPPGKLAAGELPQPVRELIKATDRNRQYAAAGDH
jgi:hypothetical protein